MLDCSDVISCGQVTGLSNKNHHEIENSSIIDKYASSARARLPERFLLCRDTSPKDSIRMQRGRPKVARDSSLPLARWEI